MPRDGRLATGDVVLGRERSASSRDVRNASEDFNGRLQRCRQFWDEAMKIQLLLGLAMALQTSPLDARNLVKRTFSDQTILGYLTERTCWWNEICKEEFQILFRCKCPLWSYCRSPGRYYNAFCTMTGTGYIWTQPDRSWGI
uniref:Uncharacterized protein n=1 Tax=Timema shepardi TaxID=629360 RepID=A0A7R9B6F8_TIMSH|nr:unnamed protein product [Timema shepardi]